VLLRGARFPATTAQVVQQTGDPRVEIAAGQPMAFGDILSLVEGGYWADARELLEAVHAAWPEVRKRWDESQGSGGRNL
jgi:hypothetical protein